MTTVLESLQTALQNTLGTDPRVVLIGEDILDPYGGAFKVTKGLSSRFPDRVITSPVSEAGMVGLATGMALRGFKPVVEIMFGDFVTLAADQLVNHASKFRWVYNEQVRVPLVVRTPMGGRRGYGPTHSQSLEKLFLGVPGLIVLAPAPFGDPGRLLEDAILASEDPVLFIENKILYLLPIFQHQAQEDLAFQELFPADGSPTARIPESYAPPIYRVSIRGAPPPEITLVAYGYMAELCRKAVLDLAYEDEIFAELLVPTRLSPPQIGPVVESAHQTGRLVVVEEGTLTHGWGSEIIARIAEQLGPALKCSARVAAKDLPLPASTDLETTVLPDVEEILVAARSVMRLI